MLIRSLILVGAVVPMSLAAGIERSAVAEPTATSVSASSESSPTIDAKSKEVFDAISAFYDKQNSISSNAVLKVNFSGPMGKQEQTVNSTLAVTRPNKLAYSAVGTQTGDQKLVCDGSKIWSSMKAGGGMLNVYSEDVAPETFEGVRRHPDLALFDGGAGQLDMFMAFLTPDAGMASVQNVKSAEYLGEQESEGSKHHRIKLTRVMRELPGMPEVPCELWVQSGDSPWILRIIMDADAFSAVLAPQTGGARIEMTATLSDWKAGDVPADRFAFTPPSDAQKVTSVMKHIKTMMGQPETDAMGMTGKPAPEVEGKLLDGTTVNLAQHKGKEVVVLDFWATWCPPCKKGLPILADVVKSYKDKGVVLYVVDNGEAESKVKAYFDRAKLDVKVMLDGNKSIAAKFGVGPIPHSVYIDKDGVVRDVEVGIANGSDEDIRKAFIAAIEKALAAGGSTPEKK
ncbi:MAG TPA: redoxin family protein [Phycisphaerales bacterium]|nr:redoxin family protein [Phycisphaerales bacterium]